MNFMMTPEAAALTSNFANYANGIMGSEPMMNADLTSAPEIVMPASAPAPEFVPPCSQEVTDLYAKIWTNLNK
jgi:spermidine/putrescine transport system substrate-binding protein